MKVLYINQYKKPNYEIFDNICLQNYRFANHKGGCGKQKTVYI